MKKNTLSSKIIAGVGALTLSLSMSAAFADAFENIYDANLSGAKSVPPVHTTATGTFTTKIAQDMGIIHYKLHYDGLQGVPVIAHLHLGQKFLPNALGGALVTICDTETPNNNTPDIQDCPVSGDEITGQITADDIRSIPAQGVHSVAGGENPQIVFDQLVTFITFGLTYFNLHTVNHHDDTLPLVSELRGQLEVNDHPFPVKY